VLVKEERALALDHQVQPALAKRCCAAADSYSVGFTMVDLNRSLHGAMSPQAFLTEPSSDQISLLKVGAASDQHSLIALYRSDGRDETVRSPNQLEGFLAVIIFQDMKKFTLRRNKKALEIPRSLRGAAGLHDLRNEWSSPKYPVFSMNFIFSSAFLAGLPLGSGYRGMDLLRDAPDYGNHDQVLLYMASALLPAFDQPAHANRLFVDQVFLAASTHLISKYGSQQPLGQLRGGLTPWQEKTAKDFLVANIRANVSLADAADLCDLSAPHFARLFKKSTGTSPYKWLIERRLAQSKALLESTSDELATIALACGFADQSHFTRTFTRIVGLSPGAWRRLRKG